MKQLQQGWTSNVRLQWRWERLTMMEAGGVATTSGSSAERQLRGSASDLRSWLLSVRVRKCCIAL